MAPSPPEPTGRQLLLLHLRPEKWICGLRGKCQRQARRTGIPRAYLCWGLKPGVLLTPCVIELHTPERVTHGRISNRSMCAAA
ncbi:hypothetical protein AOLI_G00065970 [Acnodon oligacanthus]